MRRLALLVLLLPLLLPGAASAATVSVGAPPPDLLDLLYHGLRFSAAAGEKNRVTITVATSQTTVIDTGAPLTAGAGCVSLDAHRVRCTAPLRPPLGGPDLSIDAVEVDLGDRDDTLAVAFPSPIRAPSRTPGYVLFDTAEALLVVDAGAGGDLIDATHANILGRIGRCFPRCGLRRSGLVAGVELRGGPGRDTLKGGGGNDALAGGPDADVLLAGAGWDELSGDGPSRAGRRGDDLLDGGPGPDLASYAERLAPVVADLERGRGGGRGERDRLRAIEHIDGGSGHDRLLGDAGANRLWGLEPPTTSRSGDELVGRAGDDLLRPFSRHDRLACDAGNDVVLRPLDGALVPPSCEWVSLGWAAVWLTPATQALDLTAISRGAVGGTCAYFWLHRSIYSGGSVSLSSPLGVPYGRARWPSSYPRWQEDKRVSFQLNAAGRRAAASHRIAVVRAAWGKDPNDTRKINVGIWRIRL